MDVVVGTPMLQCMFTSNLVVAGHGEAHIKTPVVLYILPPCGSRKFVNMETRQQFHAKYFPKLPHLVTSALTAPSLLPNHRTCEPVLASHCPIFDKRDTFQVHQTRHATQTLSRLVRYQPDNLQHFKRNQS